MIRDPRARGRHLAALFLDLAPRLWRDLAESDAFVSAEPDTRRARDEWDAFALYACVRGLVAAGGFNRETGQAIEALHQAVLEAWRSADGAREPERRAHISERYAEYGAIGQAGGAAGAETVTMRLGEAAARHLAGGEAPAALAELVGALHQSLAEGVAEAVREAGGD